MAEDWIEAVMRMNTAIVAAETRFNAQVGRVVAMTEGGHDTTQAEGLLVSYQRSLDLLRTLQAQLLRNLENDA